MVEDKVDMMRISAVNLTTHVHATEDLEKVRQALLFLLPATLHDKLKLNIIEVKGYWNNPIAILQAKFTNTDDTMQIIKYLANSLNDREKTALKRGLERRIDKSHLYLRFDKQAAFNKRLQIEDEDDIIRLKITFTIYSPTHTVKSICESLLTG